MRSKSETEIEPISYLCRQAEHNTTLKDMSEIGIRRKTSTRSTTNAS